MFTVAATVPPTPPPRLLDHLQQAALAHFGRPEPGQRYARWALRLILFHGMRHSRELGMAQSISFSNTWPKAKKSLSPLWSRHARPSPFFMTAF